MRPPGRTVVWKWKSPSAANIVRVGWTPLLVVPISIWGVDLLPPVRFILSDKQEEAQR